MFCLFSELQGANKGENATTLWSNNFATMEHENVGSQRISKSFDQDKNGG
jgi:hypothetical protein